MKTRKIFLFLTLSFWLLAACAPAAAAPAPAVQPAEPISPPAAAAPTATPEAQPAPAADDWTLVQSNGVLRVGTAGDYHPFSFYDQDSQLDGYDIALAREVAGRLGVKVEFTNFAFEGLPATLQFNQVDAVFAALSLSPRRLEQMDFSSVYYTGSDGVLARKDSGLNAVSNPSQLIGSRIGVQRGSVYEEWLTNILVQTGMVGADSIFSYAKATEAVRDLKENRVDLVVIDLEAARSALQDTSVKLVGSGLYNQAFAAGFRKGSTLTGQVNRVLQEMAADGTLARLTEQYMGFTPAPVPQPTQAAPTLTAAPAPATCVNAMQYVSDVNYDDANMTKPPVLNAGETFTKTWKIKNIGTCSWAADYYLGYAYGNVNGAHMAGTATRLGRTLAPGKELEVSVKLKAPDASGRYQGFWNLYTASDVPFGSTIWVGIQVKGKETPAPAGAPRVAYFSFKPAEIQVNQCSTVYWQVNGQVDTIRLYDAAEKLVWDKAPAAGSYKFCPGGSGNQKYLLEARGPGGTDWASVILPVSQPAPSKPVISVFNANPGEVTLPACAFLQWSVSGASDITLFRDGVAIQSGQPASGGYQFCAADADQYNFQLVATNSAGQQQTASLSVMINPPVPEPR